MDPDGTIYYNTESEMENAIDEIFKTVTNRKKFSKECKRSGWIILNQHDSKIPPMKIGQTEHYF